MTKPDLKPCPFCGGEKHTICRTDYDYDNKDAYAVSCRYHNCHGSIFRLGYGYFATKDEAIAAWNTRAIDPAAIREAALREAAAVAWIYGYEFTDVVQERILDLIGEKK